MDTRKSKSLTPLMKVGQVAEALGISKSFAYNLIKTGELPHVTIGSAIRVKVDDLEHYIKNNTSQPDCSSRW